MVRISRTTLSASVETVLFADCESMSLALAMMSTRLSEPRVVLPGANARLVGSPR